MLQKFCSLCKKNGEQEVFWSSHKLRDENNKITCPILLEYTCPCCNEKGVHTKSYCPKSPNAGKRGQASFSRESCIGRKPGGGRKFGASRNYPNNDNPNRSFKNNNDNDTMMSERFNNSTGQPFDRQDQASLPFGTIELPAAANNARAVALVAPPPPLAGGETATTSPSVWSNVPSRACSSSEMASSLSPELTSHLNKFMLMTSRQMLPPARNEFLANFGYDRAKIRLVESTAAIIREIISRQIGDDPDKIFLWQAMCP